MPVLVRAHRESDIRLALKLAQEEKLRIILDGADEGWMVAQEIAAAHVPVVLNATDDLPESFEQLGATMNNAARLQAAGVEVVVSGAPGDSGGYRVRELRYLAGNAVAYGLPWNEALKAVTLNPARVFGVADKSGSLEAGLRVLGAPIFTLVPVGLLISLLVGLEASTLRRFKLARRHWRNIGVVTGDGVDEVERRFFDAWIRQTPPRRPPPPPSAPAAASGGSAGPVGPAPAPSGVIGLFPEPGAPR